MIKDLKDHNYNGIDATIIADSKNEFGNRITTFVVTFPRIILAEVNTHRMFSRNSASSRAIPFEKMLERVKENPFIPIAWQKDHKGMQGTEYHEDPFTIEALRKQWLEARDRAIGAATELADCDVTKQLCNRLLEPFMWHTAIITATEFENFFHLRCPQYYYEPEEKSFRSKKDFSEYWFQNFGSGIEEAIDEDPTLFWLKLNKGQGEIHIMALAEVMWDAYNESTPKELKAGEWHIPFGDNLDEDKAVTAWWNFTGNEQAKNHEEAFQKVSVKIATARCARVSYMNFEGKDDYEADIKLHDRLMSSGHWSPFEHCARSMSEEDYNHYFIASPDKTGSYGWSGNFRGFVQYRKMFIDENK